MKNNNKNNSILDKVLSAKGEADLEQFDPVKMVYDMLGELKPREEDIIIRRFSLSGKPRQPLEEIGKSYGITRERVRQIESSILKNFRNAEKLRYIESAVKIINIVLHSHGNIMEELMLLDKLSGSLVNNSSPAIKHAILFIMELSDDFNRHSETKEYRNFWSIQNVSLDTLEKVIKAFIEVLELEKKPIHTDDIFDCVKDHNLLQDIKDELDKNKVYSYLSVSKKVEKNPFDEWGLIEWNEIVPRGIKDKAYIVLKKNKKPLHFREIAELIDKYNFNNKKAHPQTVHNELIKDKRFVLVGRGIYALIEWGYKPGTVADVLVRILKEEKKPLSKEELLNRVLKERMVKKNTILLGLQDESKFKKIGEDKYTLIEVA